MDDISNQRTLHVMPLSAQSEDRWRLTDPYVERLWSERLGPKATLLARRPSGGGCAAHERQAAESEVWRPVRAVPGAEGRGQSAVGCSGSLGLAACVVQAGRMRSGRRSGRSASPGRVPSEVGSGRSCIRVVGGHTPLQVPLRGTCGTQCVPSGDHFGGSLSGRRTTDPSRPDRARSCV